VQALSKRIHYGKFVAEAKFQESPENYMPAIIAQVCGLVFGIYGQSRCTMSFFFTCEFQIDYGDLIPLQTIIPFAFAFTNFRTVFS
jgi:hypothetical protein